MADKQYKNILIEREGGITFLWLNRPDKRNAMSPDLHFDMDDALDWLEQERGLSVPLHIDAASGGFVAPFLQPELEWDFRIPRVQSINASGHKYGLVYPGVGNVLEMWSCHVRFSSSTSAHTKPNPAESRLSR